MRNVIIIGKGGYGNVIEEIVRLCGDKCLGFLDDDPSKDVLGAVSDYVKYPDACFFIAIGNPKIRKRIAETLGNVEWYTAIHPSAVISSSSSIGEGSAVMPLAVVGTNAVIGKHCIINSSAIVEHDNRLENFVHISVGARLGGTVNVGESTWLGIGSCVVNNVDICSDCMIGAGAVVVKNIKEKGTYVGVPAKLKND